MSLVDIVATILMFSCLGVAGLIISRRVPLPLSLILVFLGFTAAYLILPLGWDTGIRASNFQHIMLYGLLPILIFDAAFCSAFFRELAVAHTTSSTPSTWHSTLNC